MNVWKWSFASAALTVGLVSCPGPQPTITLTKASVNGFTINGDKSANLNVSALDNSNAVLKNGKLSDASVTAASMLSWKPRQQAEPVPVTASASVCGDITSQSGSLTSGILLDASGSMSRTDPSKQRAVAAKAFVDRLQGSDLAAVTSFSGTAQTPPYTELTIHKGFTADKDQLKTAIDAAAVNGGGTPLWKSTAELVDFVGKQGGSNKIGFVFTDGNADDTSKLQAAIDAANAAKVRLFMLGLGTPSSLDVADMQRAATDTGGLYAVTSNATDLNLVFNGAFNASQGAGCIKLVFTPAPVAGNKITGTLNFSANGVPLSAAFSVQY